LNDIKHLNVQNPRNIIPSDLTHYPICHFPAALLRYAKMLRSFTVAQCELTNTLMLVNINSDVSVRQH